MGVHQQEAVVVTAYVLTLAKQHGEGCRHMCQWRPLCRSSSTVRWCLLKEVWQWPLASASSGQPKLCYKQPGRNPWRGQQTWGALGSDWPHPTPQGADMGSTQIRLTTSHRQDSPALTRSGIQQMLKALRGVSQFLRDRYPWRCSTAVVPAPGSVGSVQAAILSLPILWAVLPAHSNAHGGHGSPAAKILNVHSKNEPLHTSFTHHIPKSCSGSGTSPHAWQPHAGFPVSSPLNLGPASLQ